jgi:hypothetical protein
MNYYLWKYLDHQGQEHDAILATTIDGNVIGIPTDPENMDYAAYLAWVAEGNTPGEWTPEE